MTTNQRRPMRYEVIEQRIDDIEKIIDDIDNRLLDIEERERSASLTRLEQAISRLDRVIKETEMSRHSVQAVIDELKAELTRNTDVVSSAKAAMQTLIDKIEEAKDDPTELNAVLAGFRQNTEALAQAIEAGTPAADPVDEGGGSTEENEGKLTRR